MNWIQTYTGKVFDLEHPTLDMICIEDIAHALARICRFTGHCREFYSVADHCCYVAAMCPDEYKIAGLLHDAAEAYVGDVSSPLQRAMIEKNAGISVYTNLAQTIEDLIAEKFGLTSMYPPVVQEVDRRLLMTEARDLFDGLAAPWNVNAEPYPTDVCNIVPCKHVEYAEQDFLDCFDTYWPGGES